jgi:hypothetical protein
VIPAKLVTSLPTVEELENELAGRLLSLDESRSADDGE